MRYLVAPALIAMLIMLPLLTVFADAVAIFGAALYSASALNITPTAYMLQTLSLLTPGDVGQGIAKSAVFALLITLIGVSTGFSVSGGAEGVGRSTTRAVVLSICWNVADMIFSYFLIENTRRLSSKSKTGSLVRQARISTASISALRRARSA